MIVADAFGSYGNGNCVGRRIVMPRDLSADAPLHTSRDRYGSEPSSPPSSDETQPTTSIRQMPQISETAGMEVALLAVQGDQNGAKDAANRLVKSPQEVFVLMEAHLRKSTSLRIRG